MVVYIKPDINSGDTTLNSLGIHEISGISFKIKNFTQAAIKHCWYIVFKKMKGAKHGRKI